MVFKVPKILLKHINLFSIYKIYIYNLDADGLESLLIHVYFSLNSTYVDYVDIETE